MAPCFLFLAAKVEEAPIRLEYVLKTAHMFIHPKSPPPTEKELTRLKNDLIYNENLLLQTLGFDFIILHPHTPVIECAALIRATKGMTRQAYDLATNSLHFTTMCVRYTPEVVACVCLNTVLKGHSLTIGPSEEGKYWWNHFSKDLTKEELESITEEYANIMKHSKNFKRWMQPEPRTHGSQDSHMHGGSTGR